MKKENKILLEEIEEVLTTLGKEELQRLRKKIDFLLTFKKTSADANSTSATVLYNEISKVLLKRHGIKSPPLAILRNNKSNDLYHTVETVCEWLLNWADLVLKRRATKVEIQKLFMMYATTMTDWLEGIQAFKSKDWNVPITIKNILNNYDKFPSLLDRQFPDYIRSGLFSVIFNGGDFGKKN